MKRNLFFLLLLCTAGAQAELYKWVGPDGKINYSDTPPPKSASQVQKKPLAAGAASGLNLPYELSEAVKNNPVTLYTTLNCLPCDEGRNLLKSRGIPFAEKTVKTNDDMATLRLAGGGSQLPFLIVGNRPHHGFEPGAWAAALLAAGYPESSRLPGNYRYPQPEPAAPAKAATIDNAAPHEPAAKPNAHAVPASPSAPPGFRF